MLLQDLVNFLEVRQNYVSHLLDGRSTDIARNFGKHLIDSLFIIVLTRHFLG